MQMPAQATSITTAQCHYSNQPNHMHNNLSTSCNSSSPRLFSTAIKGAQGINPQKQSCATKNSNDLATNCSKLQMNCDGLWQIAENCRKLMIICGTATLRHSKICSN
jgi:hypothetical protein